jgi:hypothetical protein
MAPIRFSCELSVFEARALNGDHNAIGNQPDAGGGKWCCWTRR